MKRHIGGLALRNEPGAAQGQRVALLVAESRMPYKDSEDTEYSDAPA
jgi:hypothetical protein